MADRSLDAEEVTAQIRTFTSSIYKLGSSTEENVREVSVSQIVKKYKGSPVASAELILRSLDLFNNALLVINQLKQDTTTLRKNNTQLNSKLSAARSVEQVAEKTGRSILKLVSDRHVDETAGYMHMVKTYAHVLQKKSAEVSKLVSEVNLEQVMKKAVEQQPAASVMAIKSAVREVVRRGVEEEDRSKNIIIFGSPEDPEESTLSLAENILEASGVPTPGETLLGADRFGRDREGRPRPIRVTFRSKDIVHEVLKSAKKLKGKTEFKNVYISVDRSKEEQIFHKELVKELKMKMRSSPDRYWYIQNNKLCHADRRRPFTLQIDTY